MGFREDMGYGKSGKVCCYKCGSENIVRIKLHQSINKVDSNTGYIVEDNNEIVSVYWHYKCNDCNWLSESFKIDS